MPEVIKIVTRTGRSIGIDYRLRRRRVSSSRMGTGLGWFIQNRKIAAIIKKNITVSIFAMSFLGYQFSEVRCLRSILWDQWETSCHPNSFGCHGSGRWKAFSIKSSDAIRDFHSYPCSSIHGRERSEWYVSLYYNVRPFFRLYSAFAFSRTWSERIPKFILAIPPKAIIEKFLTLSDSIHKEPRMNTNKREYNEIIIDLIGVHSRSLAEPSFSIIWKQVDVVSEFFWTLARQNLNGNGSYHRTFAFISGS